MTFPMNIKLSEIELRLQQAFPLQTVARLLCLFVTFRHLLS